MSTALTDEQIDEIFERSKDDRAIIVGSEIRQLCAQAKLANSGGEVAVVPIEPTNEMLDAAIDWRFSFEVSDKEPSMRDQFTSVYKAMLAAAPASPSAQDIFRQLCAQAKLANSRSADALDVEMLVNRFLSWKLPRDFAPDCRISFDNTRSHDGRGYPLDWPIGTNLFTSTQAREMFEFLLADSKPVNADSAQLECTECGFKPCGVYSTHCIKCGGINRAQAKRANSGGEVAPADLILPDRLDWYADRANSHLRSDLYAAATHVRKTPPYASPVAPNAVANDKPEEILKS